jgi:uncharacterized membrane protein SirB2
MPEPAAAHSAAWLLALGPHYGVLKHLHQACVACSLLLFALRWAGVLRRAAWPLQPQARHASVGLDTLLLATGLALWWAGGWQLLQAPWLQAKLLLLLLYIVLGSFALKRARTRRARLLCGLAALAVAAQMVGVALWLHPLGWGYALLDHAT